VRLKTMVSLRLFGYGMKNLLCNSVVHSQTIHGTWHRGPPPLRISSDLVENVATHLIYRILDKLSMVNKLQCPKKTLEYLGVC